MKSDPVFLGIDTSNYTTSAAAVDAHGNILADNRRLLEVKKGEKGLRQSDALFQHWKALPDILTPILSEYRDRIVCVCSSVRPRPAEGSYMPVFTAGANIGRVTAEALGVRYTETSHQQMHLYSAAHGNDVVMSSPVLLCHLSGGTLEFVDVRGDIHDIAFATKDISYGQLLDRLGVDLGFPFPAGRYIDEAAVGMAPEGRKNPFKRVFMDGTGLNLSGLETALRTAEKDLSPQECAYFAMESIAESFCRAVEKIKKSSGTEQVLVCGGVASSRFLRNYCEGRGYMFGDPRLCSDNAVGCALYAATHYDNV